MKIENMSQRFSYTCLLFEPPCFCSPFLIAFPLSPTIGTKTDLRCVEDGMDLTSMDLR